jgi:hypothetical protein
MSGFFHRIASGLLKPAKSLHSTLRLPYSTESSSPASESFPQAQEPVSPLQSVLPPSGPIGPQSIVPAVRKTAGGNGVIPPIREGSSRNDKGKVVTTHEPSPSSRSASGKMVQVNKPPVHGNTEVRKKTKPAEPAPLIEKEVKTPAKLEKKFKDQSMMGEKKGSDNRVFEHLVPVDPAKARPETPKMPGHKSRVEFQPSGNRTNPMEKNISEAQETIHIGRVEVTVAPPAQAAKRARGNTLKPMSLGEYLDRHQGRGA